MLSVILSEAKNLGSSLLPPKVGQKALAAVPNPRLDRATVGWLAPSAQFSCPGANLLASSRTQSRHSHCESVQPKRVDSADNVS